MAMENAIKVPEGVKADVRGRVVTISGSKGTIERLIEEGVDVEKKDDTITLRMEGEKRRQRAVIGTYSAHLENMIKGASEGFEKRLKIIFRHFPINVKVEQNEVVIRNYLGEKSVRKATILPGVKVTIEGDEIKVTGADIEKVGQTAANMEAASKLIGRKDRRVFEDGIYMLQGGR